MQVPEEYLTEEILEKCRFLRNTQQRKSYRNAGS
jgi:hypothetical protein